MHSELVRGPGGLAQAFSGSPEAKELVGIELECGVVDPETGRSAPYEGASGTRALLQALVEELDGTPVRDGSHLVGVRLPAGGEFSLEMGGALEFSAAPSRTLFDAVEHTRERVRLAAGVADRLSLALLSGGILPFTPMQEVPWIPKKRVQIMRNYFRRLGEGGSLADGVMGITLSAQTSLDYVSASDLFAKLRMLTLAAPVVAALFVSSPIENGAPTGALSRRMQFWRKIDPARCGTLVYALDPEATVDDVVDWALRLPMIYRSTPANGHEPAPPGTFQDLLSEGFGDGTRPTYTDWESHLSQVWPNVRVRRTLEARLPDGPPWPHFASSVALWVGLTYDETARTRVLDLLGGLTLSDIEAAVDSIALKGLATCIGPYPVQDLARELVSLARRGLAARVARGVEPPSVLGYLDPIGEVADTSVTFAERCLSRWDGDLRRDPAAYVQAFRVT
ncbi:MAG TPA: glutamate-cysteine ligase family protein [Micromonosporaceae bacterium]|nr:glutamate-cysteine ligase family protein [Micromonosporaceae bacterium]